MDFNQLLSLAKKNQQKNDLVQSESKKKSINTPTFCKPFVPPPPQPKKEITISTKDKIIPKSDLAPIKNNKSVPKNDQDKPKVISKPASFSELLLLAKKNVEKPTSISSISPSQARVNDTSSLKVPKKQPQSSNRIKIPVRSINDVRDRQKPQQLLPQQPKKVSPISCQNNAKPININQTPQVKKQSTCQISSGIKSQQLINSKISNRVKNEIKKPLASPVQNRPKPHSGPVRSGIAAQLGSAPVMMKSRYSADEGHSYSEDDYDSDFIDDSEDVDDKQYNKVVKIIQKTMNYDPTKYDKVNKYDDLSNMESSYRQVEKENARSARLGAKEDREDMLLELAKKRRRSDKY